MCSLHYGQDMHSEWIPIPVTIQNESVQPAHHAVITMLVDRRVRVDDRFENSSWIISSDEEVLVAGSNFNVHTYTVYWTTSRMTIFIGQPLKVSDTAFRVSLPSVAPAGPEYLLGWRIRAPGMAEKTWFGLMTFNVYAFQIRRARGLASR